MNRKTFVHSFAVAVASLVFTLAATPSALAETPGLHPGETLRYDEGLRVTFINVLSDSRCPIHALCVWAGDAEVALRIKVGNQPAKTMTLHTNLKPKVLVIPANPPGTVGIPKSYVISIAALNPLPVAGKKTKPEDYRLKLNISVAQ